MLELELESTKKLNILNILLKDNFQNDTLLHKLKYHTWDKTNDEYIVTCMSKLSESNP